ncbi:MAG: hypothetical protein ACYDA4_16750 [Ignavibacteriaceae bacterium]
MKNRYLTGFFLLISGILIFPGCYTMVWMPDQNLPDSTQTVDNFYPEAFYGSYGGYYNSPWWANIAQSYQTNSSTYNGDANQSQSFIRAHEVGRSSPTSGILNVLSPATVRGGSTASPASNSNNNNPPASSEARVGNSNSSTNNAATSRGNSTDKNNSVRNNNGSRNTNGRK